MTQAQLTGDIYEKSIVKQDDTTFLLVQLHNTNEKRLLINGDAREFAGEEAEEWLVCPLTAQNAATLRARLPWLNPVPLGRETSFGYGDRLGIATPGHIASVRAVLQGKPIAPIYAQQSVRENDRTGRTPQNVVDDAMWGVFQEGWRAPWGADADHVKVVADLPPFIAAGYTFYTIDPSDHVDNDAQSDSSERLQQKAADFPWAVWGNNYEALMAEYCTGPLVGDLAFDEETLLRALAKYGRAILHTETIAKALDAQIGNSGYDLEMSVDETDTPTSIHEHYFIANELLKRNLPVVSLAPRFVGKFQKGVDYMGDLAEFEAELVQHMVILHHFGKYKISVHTGSDKFSIYDIVNKHAEGYVHVKTAGTSYLEALRVAAHLNIPLFRSCFDLAHQRFEIDRKSYFIDCDPAKVPSNAELDDNQLPDLLEEFNARQLLHVTFGSILDEYGDELKTFLNANEEAYQRALEVHFTRHLKPFA